MAVREKQGGRILSRNAFKRFDESQRDWRGQARQVVSAELVHEDKFGEFSSFGTDRVVRLVGNPAKRSEARKRVST